jgi:hypothetical protein
MYICPDLKTVWNPSTEDTSSNAKDQEIFLTKNEKEMLFFHKSNAYIIAWQMYILLFTDS